MSSPLHVHIEQYDGPLDLLLDLIRKHQIDIYNIPIAQITAQYLEYMDKAQAMDIELGAEFIYMAATLIHIKSKTLLPRDPELEKLDPQEDPRQELVERLIEHERFKNAAEMLQQKRLVEEAVWSNPAMKDFIANEEQGLSVTLFDLVQTLQKVIERAKNRPQFEIMKEDVTVPDMIHFLKRTLKALAEGKSISATELFERQRSVGAMISLFLAILEMVKNQAVRLVQAEAFGDIGLARTERFEEAFPEGEAIAKLEEEYS